MITAAGGVVLRRVHDRIEVLVVHRPRYADWSLPKGKHEPGEADDACALREVWEETGLKCEIVAAAGTTTYVDHRGRPKTVTFFVMFARSGDFVPSVEVDRVRWWTPEDADRLLAHESERQVLRDVLFHGVEALESR